MKDGKHERSLSYANLQEATSNKKILPALKNQN